jgi:PAT family beta-lactamase induction signal transducer AmpG
MNIPFILAQGFSKTEYFVIVKGIGTIGLFGGALLGGFLMLRLSLKKALWIFGILQIISTFGFILLMPSHSAFLGEWESIRLKLLGVVVCFEFLSTGLGQAAYASYMATQTDKRFTATQYALLTSLMALPNSLAAAVTGFMAESLGWVGFYCVCALLGIPGMLLLLKLFRRT